MNTRNVKLIALSAMGLAAVLALGASLHIADAAPRDAMAERLQRLEDREQILEVLNAYGATLDRRDFTAFGQLFAEDAAYGSEKAPTRGRAAIQAMLEKTLAANPSNLPGPNSHLYFNPSIHVEGDRATVQSKGAYTVPDAATKTTQLVFFISYDDTLVRRDGRWVFQQRFLK
jgi:ketosteroid isomerase-like protein